METDDLKLLATTSAALKLLRTKSYVLIVSFFFKAFKGENNRAAVSEDQLIRKLIDHLDYFTSEEMIDEDLDHREWLSLDEEQKAIKKLDKWASQGFLLKYPDDSGMNLFELSSDSEKVMLWIELLQKRGHVGTESRFVDILFKMKEIVENTSDNYEQRIKELEKKKQEIESEIRTIRITRSVEVYSKTQIEERLDNVLKLSKELLTDFGEVEGNFQQIMRDIYKKHSDTENRRGDIVHYALDALDELKEQDQGKSFYAFWKFLTDDKSQENFRNLVEAIYSLIETQNIDVRDNQFLSRIKSQLFYSGKKVIDANKKLSDRLSRIIAEKNSIERRRTLELINQIKQVALSRVENPPPSEGFMDADTYPEVFLVSSRHPTVQGDAPAQRRQPEGPGGGNIADLDLNSLFNQFYVDKQELQSNIDQMLAQNGQVTLREIIERYPVRKGLTEIITYLSLASQSDRHIIDGKFPIKIPLDKEGNKYIEIPQVIYNK